MNTMNRVSRRFSALNNSDLITFSRNVVVKMTGNPVFTTPLVALADLTLATNEFSTAVEAALNGGKQQIAARDQARESLLGLLIQEAAYVESLTSSDLSNLLSSGFAAVNTNRTQIALPKPNIADVENSASTQLTVKVEPVRTARAYEVRMSYGPNGWQSVGVFTQARRIVLNNLTPGTTYTVQVRAIGGSTGSSDWSDPVSHMSL